MLIPSRRVEILCLLSYCLWEQGLAYSFSRPKVGSVRAHTGVAPRVPVIDKKITGKFAASCSPSVGVVAQEKRWVHRLWYNKPR